MKSACARTPKTYATLLTDLTDPSKPEILAVAKGRDEAAGRQCLEVLSPEQRAAVLTHCTGKHGGNGATWLRVERCCPRASR